LKNNPVTLIEIQYKSHQYKEIMKLV